MQTNNFCRAVAALACSAILAGCSPPVDNPYAKLKDPPLVHATLHTATIVSPDAVFPKKLNGAGYSYSPLPSNYPAAVRVEAMLWKVPEDFAATPVILMADPGQGPNLRVLIMPSVTPPVSVDAEVEKAFFRNVLGVDVPRLPGSVKLPDGARVQVWTYYVADVVAAKRRCREAGIPVTFEPVAITTAYLGDHRVMGIEAPDGTVIELVQNVTR